MKPRNICGPVVARLRRRLELTQAELQARCRQAGWPVARSVLAKVERQSRSVSDLELVALARALRVNASRLIGAATRPKRTGKRS